MYDIRSFEESMNIRGSKTEDINSIQQVHENAFGESEGAVVAKLACEILQDKTAKPLLSLVAEDGTGIIGNIIFSSVKISGHDEVTTNILAPLAVIKKHQKQGLGTKLINHGLETLKKRGIEIVLVLGDPNYYSRTGFKAEHNIEPPYKLEYPEAWQALELKSGAIKKIKGIAQCANSLNSSELW